MFCKREIGIKSLVYRLHNSYFGVEHLAGGVGPLGLRTPLVLVLRSVANGRAAQPTLRTFLWKPSPKTQLTPSKSSQQHSCSITDFFFFASHEGMKRPINAPVEPFRSWTPLSGARTNKGGRERAGSNRRGQARSRQPAP